MSMETFTHGQREFRLYTAAEWASVRRAVQAERFRPYDISTGELAGTPALKQILAFFDKNGGQFNTVLVAR
jgi:hypothetical protein